MTPISVHRLDYGYFVRPGEETPSGSPRVEPCLGYLVRHPQGVLLFDTGMGSRPDVDDHYRPRRVGVAEALAMAGGSVAEIDLVANCHLHFDHCGGNGLFAGRPILTQAVELATARTAENYTLAELIDSPGTRYQELTGETEVLPGMLLIPTPGHTQGHQSLVVRQPDGTVVVAGQSHENAADFSADMLAWRAHQDQHAAPLPRIPGWIERLRQLDPARVVFAHDHSVWQP
ncbi:N-acyl homoserine lactonase family protein [Jatrophihabitans sp.]|jgi:N-acyl homoserine lactone hydrolase|uniref:N-acyl homoserine lactonase family protein n=1 Tax=Jatrophihabitans sp. TaxID=1932789 RepID=UPI002F09CE1E